jgi:putrescine transport system permease protein
LTLGRVLWIEFFTNRDWAVASAITVLLLLLSIALFAVSAVVQRRSEPS